MQEALCHVISNLTDLRDPHVCGLRDKLTKKHKSGQERADTPRSQARADFDSRDECDRISARALSPDSGSSSAEDSTLETSGEVDDIFKDIGLRKKKAAVKTKTKTAKVVTDPIMFQVLAGTEPRGKDSLEKANQLLKAGKMLDAPTELINQLLMHKIGPEWNTELITYKNELILGNSHKKEKEKIKKIIQEHGLTIFLTKEIDKGTKRQAILEIIGEIHEEGNVKGLNSFLLMGPETPMSTILSEGIKYDRKSAVMKDKGGEKDKSKDRSFIQKGIRPQNLHSVNIITDRPRLIIK
ncbi:uncharacterized protein LOC120478221 [Tachysurus ichikawai]